MAFGSRLLCTSVSSRLASLQRETFAQLCSETSKFCRVDAETRVEKLLCRAPTYLSPFLSLRCTPRFLPTNGPIPSFSFCLATQHGAHNTPPVSSVPFVPNNTAWCGRLRDFSLSLSLSLSLSWPRRHTRPAAASTEIECDDGIRCQRRRCDSSNVVVP